MCYVLFNFHTVGSSVSTALQQLMDTCPLTTAQVNREVQQEDVSYLAPCFDNVELYVDAMKLTPGEQSDVQLKKSNHLAMIECLKIWRGKQRSQATFRALLEMLVKLRKGEIADLVCQYLKVSVCVYPLIIIVSPNLRLMHEGKLCPYHSVYRCVCALLCLSPPTGVSLSNCTSYTHLSLI